MPGVKSVAQISAGIVHMRLLELDATPEEEMQSHPDWRPKYTLRLKLPQYVDDEDMECSFDVSKCTLTLRVPVVEEEEQ